MFDLRGFRRTYPEYDYLDDDTILSVTGYSPAETIGYGGREEDEEDKFSFKSLPRGLARGLYSTAAVVPALGAMAADVVGLEETVAKPLSRAAQRLIEKGAEYKPRTEFKEVWEDPSVAGVADQLLFQLGNIAPSMLVGGGGAAIGKTMLGKAAQRGALGLTKGLVEKQAAKLAAEGLTKKEALRQAAEKLGTRIGIVGATAPMESGHMFLEDVEKHGIEDANPFKSALLGTAAGGVEVLGGHLRVIDKILGNKPAREFGEAVAKNKLGKAGRIIKEAAAVGGPEAFQELTQEGLAVANELWTAADQEEREKILKDSDLKYRLGESAFAGLVGGVVPGGISGLQRQIAPREPESTRAEDIEKALGPDEDRQDLVEDRIGEITGTRIRPEEPAPTPADMRQYEIDLQMPEYGAETIARPTKPLTQQVLQEMVARRQAEREAPIDEFVNRIVQGEQIESPEDLQFYENNKQAIEAKLQNIAQGAPDVTPDEARMGGIIREGEEAGRPIQEQGAGPEAVEANRVLETEEAPEGVTDVTQLQAEAPRVTEAQAEEVPEAGPEPQLPKDLSKYKVRVKAMREATGETIEIEENADTAIKEVDNRMSVYDQLLNCLSG